MKEEDLMSIITKMNETVLNLQVAPSIFKTTTLAEYSDNVGWVPKTEPFVLKLYNYAHASSAALDKVFTSEADFAHCVIIGLLNVFYDLHSWFSSIQVKIALPAGFDKIFLQDVINHSMYVFCAFILF